MSDAKQSNALEEAHALIRSLFNSMPIGIIICDGSGNIEASNKRCEQFFLRETRELSKLNIVKLIDLPESSDVSSWLMQAVGATTITQGAKATGATMPIEITAEYIGNSKERILLCISDVSERHRIEQLKKDFVAMISHDLRTPLTSVQAFLEGLAAGMYDNALHQARQRAQNTEADVARLINLVNSLLDIEKMEAGKMTIDPEVFPVERLLERSMDSVRALCERSQIKLTSRASDNFLFADENQLVQVIVNLLSNAIKFSPKGETVSIMASESESFILFQIIDHGRGIPETHQSKIFDRFEQVEAGDAILKGGTGLGLAICKAIVSAHGGEIGVTSELGVGSTFWFKIPMRESDSL